MRFAGVVVTSLAAAAMLAPTAAGQEPTQDSVAGTGSGSGFFFEVDARSGPSGENPTGQVIVRLEGPSGSIVFNGPVTCLAVRTITDDIGLVRGREATFNARNQATSAILTSEVTLFGRPFRNDFGSAFANRSPTDCSPLTNPQIRGVGGFSITDAQRDVTPPVLTVPPGVTTNATSLAGAPVTYSVSANDDRDPSPDVTCNPPSGSTFPIGTTKVTCTATDETGNQTTKSFNVVVLVPTSKDECKADGWRKFGTLFKNQGACVSFIATGGKRGL